MIMIIIKIMIMIILVRSPLIMNGFLTCKIFNNIINFSIINSDDFNNDYNISFNFYFLMKNIA